MDPNDGRKRGAMEATGETLGGMAGRFAGRAADTAMDVAGSLASSTFRTLGGWWSGSEAEEAASRFSETNDGECRRHFESTARGSSSNAHANYDSARPAYGFGYVARHNPEYQGKPFDRVERDLERAWERAGQSDPGDWPEVQDRVRFGYDIQ